MIIGTTKELKNHEYRVGLTPDNVMTYVAQGHTVYVETGAGMGAGFTDEEYMAAGAKILATPKEVFDIADMIVKVKEPEKCEWDMLRPGQILYTYLHLAADREQTEALLAGKVKAFEINTGGMSRGYRTAPYPDFGFLKAIREFGGSIVINSDSHCAKHIFYRHDLAVELALEAGFRSQRILTPTGWQDVGLI